MKVVNMGNIADAFRFDNLPATGIVIEATPEELELLPNLVYRDVTISEHVSNAAAMRKALENGTVADIAKRVRRDCNSYPLPTAAAEMLKLVQEMDAAHQREVAELRKCLKEAIREKCPFTRMSCKHGEPCDYECGTDKWRKVLREKGGVE